MILGLLLLLTGLTISAVAIYYSVLGLAAIFAAATIPIYIMGGTLEVAKLVAATWLKANWHRATGVIKWYMTVAVIILMLITSMGIFGFLSKAHLDQSVPTGDVAAQVALIDEKIKTQKDNIEASRAALAQMDAQVNQRLSGSNVDQSAERSVQIRRQQARERARLQAEIGQAQKEIAKLNEERAPIASQLRKVEAEVGPIKYIAQFIYGQEADQNLLEKAVTWVIILIVVVFDPLAVAMLLAAQMTLQWYRSDKEQKDADTVSNNDNNNDNNERNDIRNDRLDPFLESNNESDNRPEILKGDKIDLLKYPYLNKAFSYPADFQFEKPIVYKTETESSLDIKQSVSTVEDPLPKIEEPLYLPTIDNIETAKVEITADSTVVKTNVEEPIEDLSKKKIHDQETRTASSVDEEMIYVQNSEQTENSLWNRLRNKISNEFKPKDYLNIVYAQGKFEDFQYDPEQEPELDKFIKDIKNGTHSFGDYPQEQIKEFANKIYEFRKN